MGFTPPCPFPVRIAIGKGFNGNEKMQPIPDPHYPGQRRPQPRGGAHGASGYVTDLDIRRIRKKLERRVSTEPFSEYFSDYIVMHYFARYFLKTGAFIQP